MEEEELLCNLKIHKLLAILIILPVCNVVAGDVEDLVSRVEKIKSSEQFKIDVRGASDIAKNVNKKHSSKKSNEYRSWARSIKMGSKSNILNTKKLNQESGLGILLKSLNTKPEDHKITSIRHYPVMVFVSSSMPKESIKTLMIESKITGAAMVFKGAIGSLRNTAEFLQKISQENVSAIIDPRLFDTFDVKAVPAFVVLADADVDSSTILATPRHDRMAGNVTLKYVLETISQGDGAAQHTAQDYLSKINKGAYEK